MTPERGTNSESTKHDGELASCSAKSPAPTTLQQRPRKILIASLRYGLVLAGVNSLIVRLRSNNLHVFRMKLTDTDADICCWCWCVLLLLLLLRHCRGEVFMCRGKRVFQSWCQSFLLWRGFFFAVVVATRSGYRVSLAQAPTFESGQQASEGPALASQGEVLLSASLKWPRGDFPAWRPLDPKALADKERERERERPVCLLQTPPPSHNPKRNTGSPNSDL